MARLSASQLLREKIQFKELELLREGELLNTDIAIFGESLKPINLLRNTVSKVFTTTNIKKKLLQLAIGLVSNNIGKKSNTQEAEKPVRRILGLVLSSVLASVAIENHEKIKEFGGQIIDFIFTKEKTETNHE